MTIKQRERRKGRRKEGKKEGRGLVRYDEIKKKMTYLI
jgi:hypothetical protein